MYKFIAHTHTHTINRGNSRLDPAAARPRRWPAPRGGGWNRTCPRRQSRTESPRRRARRSALNVVVDSPPLHRRQKRHGKDEPTAGVGTRGVPRRGASRRSITFLRLSGRKKNTKCSHQRQAFESVDAVVACDLTIVNALHQYNSLGKWLPATASEMAVKVEG